MTHSWVALNNSPVLFLYWLLDDIFIQARTIVRIPFTFYFLVYFRPEKTNLHIGEVKFSHPKLSLILHHVALLEVGEFTSHILRSRLKLNNSFGIVRLKLLYQCGYCVWDRKSISFISTKLKRTGKKHWQTKFKRNAVLSLLYFFHSHLKNWNFEIKKYQLLWFLILPLLCSNFCINFMMIIVA